MTESTAEQAAPESQVPNDMVEEATNEKKEDSFFVFLIKLVLIVAIFRSFIYSPFNIPSESMLPTLENGDYLVAAKWPYGFTSHSLPFSAPLIPGRIFAGQPERGDVVIFKHPIDGTDYIKRAIGLPGDTVEMRGGQLILNGVAATKVQVDDLVLPVDQAMIDAAKMSNRPFPCARMEFEEVDEKSGVRQCRYPQFLETLPGGISYNVLDFGMTKQDRFDPVIVPEGHIFVMGDNRDNSQDSRFLAQAGGGVGLVPQELLLARASTIMWSTDGSAEYLLPWTWFTALRSERLGNSL